MADDQDDQQTGDDRSADQETESDQQTSQDQVTDESAGQTTGDQGDEQQTTADDQSQTQETTDDQSQSQETTDDQGGGQQTTDDQSQSQESTDDQAGGQQTTDDQSQSQEATDDQGGSQQTTDDQSKGEQTTDEQGGSEQTTEDQSKDQQTTGAQGKTQTTQSGAGGSTKSFVGQNTGATQTQSTGAPDWRGRAKRALTVLQNDTSSEATRTKCMLNHILDDSHSDSYISDFFNVQQTAGGLPPNVSMEQFIAGISTHIRERLATTGATSSFGEQVSDSDFKAAVLGFDVNIRKIITFLNGVTHQAAAGKVHLALWKLILDSRKDPNSLYKCYADYLVDGGWPA